MEVEFKVEGAVIRGDIQRAGFAASIKHGPGVVLLGTGDDEMVVNYRKALALNDQWEADAEAVGDAIARYSKQPAYAAIVENVGRMSRGSVNLQRRLLLDYRLIGEPYLTYVELRELVNGSLQWALTGTASSQPIRQIRATGIWLPDESIYEDMEELARSFAAGRIEAQLGGGFQVQLRNGERRLFREKEHARSWLFMKAVPWLSDYDGETQSSAMTRAAWDKAGEALARMTALANRETFRAVVTVVSRSGVQEEHSHEGLVGMDEALGAMMGLLERVHPTAFPTPRLH